MELTSMKLTKTERSEMAGEVPPKYEGPTYPWGLSVNLDDESIAKLGLELPKVGETLMLHAKVTVSRASKDSHVDEGGKTHSRQSLTLQITDMALNAVDVDAAKKLYGE